MSVWSTIYGQVTHNKSAHVSVEAIVKEVLRVDDYVVNVRPLGDTEIYWKELLEIRLECGGRFASEIFQELLDKFEEKGVKGDLDVSVRYLF